MVGKGKLNNFPSPSVYGKKHFNTSIKKRACFIKNVENVYFIINLSFDAITKI